MFITYIPKTDLDIEYKPLFSAWKLYSWCLWNKENQEPTFSTATNCDNDIVHAITDISTIFRDSWRIDTFTHLFFGNYTFFTLNAFEAFKNVRWYTPLLSFWLWSCNEIVSLLWQNLLLENK